MIRAIAFLALLLASAGQTLAGPYDIMRPEPVPPGTVKPYKSPRGTRQHVKPVQPDAPPPQQRSYATPPPIVVPQTGRVVPSISPAPFTPPGQRESFGDRATRCTHQAGMAGLPADQRGTYMGACLNQ